MSGSADPRRAAAALEESLGALRESLPPLAPAVAALAGRMVEVLRAGGRVYWLGNGGSAAQAQHASAELVGRFERERRPYASISLTVDTSILTAVANDYGYEGVFARQVQALARPGDLVIGISTSGRSANVLRALEAAREVGAATAALVGRDGSAVAGRCDLVVAVELERTAHVQEAHQILLHALCGLVESELAAR